MEDPLKVKTSLDILETIEWGLETTRQKLKFGQDDFTAALSRERRLFGILLDVKKYIEKTQGQSAKMKNVLEMVIDNSKMPHPHSEPLLRLQCLSERANEVLSEIKI